MLSSQLMGTAAHPVVGSPFAGEHTSAPSQKMPLSQETLSNRCRQTSLTMSHWSIVQPIPSSHVGPGVWQPVVASQYSVPSHAMPSSQRALLDMCVQASEASSQESIVHDTPSSQGLA